VAGMEKIIECVPNFSEGRDLKKIEKIVEPFRGKEGVKLLDYQNDEDHNRSVVTVVGEPEPLKTAVVESMGARMPLVAFNVNPDTNRLEIADQIAKKVRHISGGLRYGCGQKEHRAKGIAHRVRYRSMKGAGGSKGLRE